MKNNLDGLTIARFFAALLVILFHFHQWPDAAQKLIGGGWIAVTFFFMLSGFVLAYTARDLTTSAGRKDFYLRRVARIYPVYMLAWVLSAAVIVNDWIANHATIGYMAKASTVFGGLSAVLLQSWVPGAAEAWNLPGWSLSVEALFYATFPLIFVALAKRTTRTIFAVLGLAFLGNFACIALMTTEGELLGGTPFASTISEYLQFFPPLHLLKFVAGVALGILYVRYRDLPRPQLWLTLSVAASIGVILLHSVLPLWDAWAVAPFLLLIYAAASVRPAGPLSRVGVMLGKASYAMYILQWPVWYLMSMGRQETIPLFLAYLAVLIALSSLTYAYIEQPMERWIKSRRAVRTAQLNAPA